MPDRLIQAVDVSSQRHNLHLSRITTSPEYGDAQDLYHSGSSRSEPAAASVSTLERVVSRIRSRPPLGNLISISKETSLRAASIVDFESPEDPYRPVNWRTSKKITTTIFYGLTTMSSSWASSSFAPGTQKVALEFGVGTQTATLGTSLFLYGFGVGPLLWAPLSEVFGRKIAVLPPVFVGACFSFGAAAAKDLQTIMLCRFFSGFFGSAPVTNTGGVLGDLFAPHQRGIAMAGYAIAVVSGPALGPVVSSIIVSNPSLGWRWTEYLTGILQIFVWIIDVIFIDESYPPSLLVFKARRLRLETGNWNLHAKFEEWDVSVNDLVRKFLVRPFQLLSTPTCSLMALYASFCYGILYMQLGAIPIIFQELRGWNPIIGSLPFLTILLGACVGALLSVLNQLQYNKQYEALQRPIPEARLPPMMLGGILFAGGQFITGWTARPSTNAFVPIMGLFFIATGFFLVFGAALTYLVDTFQKYAASAVAANTFVRSVFAGSLPLVVGPLYHNLGTGIGSTITGAFAVALVPVPFVFYIFGEKIRDQSKWSKV